QVDAGVTAFLSGLTITGGSADNGAGLANHGTLTLTDCTVSGNSASNSGGGLYNLNGTLTLTNCTISGNSAGTDSGGLWNNGTATLTNCTVSGNSAGTDGGGLWNGVSLNGVDQYTITPNLAGLFPNGNTNVTVSLSFNAAGPGVIVDELGQPAPNTGWHD